MTLGLQELTAPAYAREVLPLTHTLWSNGRTLESYVRQTAELAASTYGRRHYRTFALTQDGSHALASFKRYEREARAENEQLNAIGIGAVFTPAPHRRRGYASAMLGLALDQARREHFDFAYLFSDIHPQFYKDVGFVELPSRSISLRADALGNDRIAAAPLAHRDWSAVRACFAAADAGRSFSLLRSPVVWDWIRARLRHGSEHSGSQPVNLIARRAKNVAAYVIGRREPQHDAYVVDEFGFAGSAGASVVAPLLRCAAGDLRRITGWLPPAPARRLLPRGSVRRRSAAIWMIAPLTRAGTHFLRLARESADADGVWSLDHI